MAAASSEKKSDVESTQVLAELSTLLGAARQFTAHYDRELNAFRQSNAVWGVISKAVVDYLGSETDLDQDRLDAAEQSFYSSWLHSQQFHLFEGQLNGLLDQASLALNKAFARPPSLREVHSAAKLPTKASRLVAVLALAIPKVHVWVSAGKKLPVRQVRRPRSKSSERSNLLSWLPKTWWEWLTVVAAFIAIVVYLPALLEVSRWVAVGLGVLTTVALLGIDVGVRRSRGHPSK